MSVGSPIDLSLLLPRSCDAPPLWTMHANLTGKESGWAYGHIINDSAHEGYFPQAVLKEVRTWAGPRPQSV